MSLPSDRVSPITKSDHKTKQETLITFNFFQMCEHTVKRTHPYLLLEVFFHHALFLTFVCLKGLVISSPYVTDNIVSVSKVYSFFACIRLIILY